MCATVSVRMKRSSFYQLKPSMSATLDSSTVAQYLSEHPNFFEEHTSLLGEVRLSSPLTGRAISLQERQMEVMRDKYKALELRMSNLSRIAQENGAIANKFHGWNQAMLQVRDVATMPRVLVDALKKNFDVPYASLRLWQLAPEYADAWHSQDITADVRMFANGLQTPYCGSNHDFEAVHWLGADKIASTVMIALRAPGAGTFGLLVLGSPDSARFTAEMGTDFLVHIGNTASAALDALRAAS